MFASGITEWESRVKCCVEELVHALTAFEYARNDAIIARVDAAVNSLSDFLYAYDAEASSSRGLGNVESIDVACLELLVIEGHDLVARARKLLAPYRRPRLAAAGGTAIDLRDKQCDLTDAEFERLLAASDIPVLGGNHCALGVDEADFRMDNAVAEDAVREVAKPAQPGRSHLRLVHSQPPAGKR